ncbi:MAG: hypothetical protein AUK47_15435 [Deltaproteobacteria bacterium CG2_30_63_29]|nr:MAG: hypothetical protein AUK47_15435 [Deltaproteobacteria bacterium CG2_30_63_29]
MGPLTKAACSVVALCLLASGLLSCQERAERTVALTQEQWKRVKKNVSDERPTPSTVVEATFGLKDRPLIELVGYDLSPRNLVTGKNFTVTWYWHSLEKTDTNYKAFVHLVPIGSGAFQNLDHHPVDNLYQTSTWEAGKYVTDAQTVTLKAGFSSSGGKFQLGFFEQQSGQRLSIIDPGRGTVIEDGKLEVGQTSTKNDKNLVVPLVDLDEAPVMDGLLTDPAWRIAGRTQSFTAAGDGKPVDFATTAKAIYTAEALYLGFDVRDKDIRTRFTKRDDTLWEQDCVEIYLNPDNDNGTYWELQLSPGDGENGQTPLFDAYFETHRTPAWKIAMNTTFVGLEAKVDRRGSLNSDDNTLDDTGYTVEVKIPFQNLSNTPNAIERIKLANASPKVGDTWRVNFFRVDYQETDGNKQTRHASWSPSGGDFHNLDALGTMEFGEKSTSKTSQPTPRMSSPRVRAMLTQKGRAVDPSSLSKALRESEAQFLTCFHKGTEIPTQALTHEFTVRLSAEASVDSVTRIDNGDAATMDCLVKEIETWTDLKIVELSPEPVTPPTTDQVGATAPTADDQTLRSVGIRIQYTPGGTGAHTPQRTGQDEPAEGVAPMLEPAAVPTRVAPIELRRTINTEGVNPARPMKEMRAPQ